MDYKTFEFYSKWLSQISAAIALITIIFVKSKFVFDSGNTAGNLILISIIAALLALVLGIVSLPRWQGLVAIAIFSYVAYCILFTPIYVIT